MISQVLVRGLDVVEVGDKIEFEGFDPIKVKVTWKNNKVPKRTLLYCIVLFVVYYNEQWSIVPYTYNNVEYFWGTLVTMSAPSTGETRSTLLSSYVINPKDTLSAGCRVFIVKRTRGIGVLKANFDHGDRIIGLKAKDFAALLKEAEVYGAKLFEDLFTIKPYTPPAEIQSCEVSKE